MLKRTPHGIRLFNDWSPARIGGALPLSFPISTKDSDLVQAALLGPLKMPRMEPVPVPVLDTVEKLVDFLNR